MELQELIERLSTSSPDLDMVMKLGQEEVSKYFQIKEIFKSNVEVIGPGGKLFIECFVATTTAIALHFKV